MIDLVLWSFAVAVLPMVLALAASMMAGATGMTRRSAARTDPWGRADRPRFRPTTPPAFDSARLARSGRYPHDF